MTSKERILTAIACEKPDRVPVSPWDLGKLDREGPVAREIIKETDPFISVGLGGNVFAGSAVRREARQEGSDTITTIHTPKGTLTQRYRRTLITGHTVEFPCKGPDDVEKYLSIPFQPAQPDVTHFKRIRDEIGEEGLVLAGCADAMCLPATILSPEDMCLMWADEPDLMLRLVETGAERLNAFVDAACRLGVDAFRIIGGEYASTQLGPKGFDALVSPFDTELVRVMHRYRAIAYYHNHGNVTAYYERFASLGIDALDPLEAPPYGDADLAQAKATLHGRVCLVGNLDDMEVLEKKDEDTVRAIARRAIDAAGPDGFILGGTASGTYTEKAARNFLAMAAVARECA